MAKFCNKCGAPLGGIFCVKCGADSRLTANPQPQPPPSQSVSAPPEPVTVEPASVQTATPPVSPETPVPVPVPVSVAPNAIPGAKFCNKCGAPSIGAPFCNKCGASMREAASPAPPSAAARGPQMLPPPPFPAPAQPAPVAQTTTKGSPLTKVLIGVAVVIITVGALAAGGVYYVVYRVKQKVHEVARDAGLGSSSENNSNSSGGIMGSISKMVSGSSNNDGGGSGGRGNNGAISGDPCRLLSNEEVGNAIGVQIVATQTSDAGCSYLAHGDWLT